MSQLDITSDRVEIDPRALAEADLALKDMQKEYPTRNAGSYEDKKGPLGTPSVSSRFDEDIRQR